MVSDQDLGSSAVPRGQTQVSAISASTCSAHPMRWKIRMAESDARKMCAAAVFLLSWAALLQLVFCCSWLEAPDGGPRSMS